jgi:hypothetical protein
MNEFLVEQCLRKARIELDEKVKSLISDAVRSETDRDETKAGSGNNNNGGGRHHLHDNRGRGDGDNDYYQNKNGDEIDDPDDLAAKFFARQVKKQQQQNKLPIDDWAACIVKNCKHRSTISVTSGFGHDDLDASTTQLSDEDIDSLVKDIYQDYQKIVSSS